MAKSPNKTAETDNTPQTPSNEVWLAGLGALAQVQAQGSKAFEKLVGDGLSFQRKSQEQAQQRLQEATARLTDLAQDFGQQASVRVDKLEHLFEERVAKALHRLGVPTLQDMQVLQARIHALEEQLAQTRLAKPVTTKTAPGKTVSAKAAKAASKASAKKAVSPARKKARG
jgi:poly(hydroxyalkanoate) granule-associated protein